MTAPFALGWDERGFYRQTTDADVVQRVITAYADPQYQHITAPPGASAWADRLGEIQAKFCADAMDRGTCVLEIGAGSLFLARHLADKVLPSEYVIVDPSVSDGGDVAEVIREYFPTTALMDRRFDAILAFNSLEHVADPEIFLAGIAQHLTPGGRAFLCFPDVTTAFVTNDLNAFLHEHISYFTPATVTHLASRVGLQVVSVTSSEDSLWLIVSRAGGGRTADVAEPANMAGFAAQLDASISAKAGLVRQDLAAGKTVAFHGATNGLNNFLHLTGFSGAAGVVVFDGDTTKTGRYLPTCPTPIRSVDDPSYGSMPRIFVSAMTFFEPIRRFAIDHHGRAPDSVQPLFE